MKKIVFKIDLDNDFNEIKKESNKQKYGNTSIDGHIPNVDNLINTIEHIIDTRFYDLLDKYFNDDHRANRIKDFRPIDNTISPNYSKPKNKRGSDTTAGVLEYSRDIYNEFRKYKKDKPEDDYETLLNAIKNIIESNKLDSKSDASKKNHDDISKLDPEGNIYDMIIEKVTKMKYNNVKNKPETEINNTDDNAECMCSLCNPQGYFGLFFDEDEEDDRPEYEDQLYEGNLYLVLYVPKGGIPVSDVLIYMHGKFYYPDAVRNPKDQWKEYLHMDSIKFIMPIPAEILS